MMIKIHDSHHPVLRILRQATIATALSATLAVPALAASQKLEVASTFSTQNHLGQGATYLAKEIDRITNGEVTLRVYEPGDLVPPFEVFNSVSAGAVSAGWDWMGYWAGTIPAASIYGGLPFGPDAETMLSWVWGGEGLDIIQKAYDPYGVKVLPCMVSRRETGGWYNKKIEKPEDYKGTTVRIAGFGAKILTKLGASTQLVPGNEIYLALERGRVEAAEFSTPLVDSAMGFEEVAKYYYFPGWHQGPNFNSLLINKSVWDGFSDQRKAQFEAACRSTAVWSITESVPQQMRAIEQFKQKGVEVLRLPDPVLEELMAAWGEVLAEEKAKDPIFKKAYESLMDHVGQFEQWNGLQRVSSSAAEKGER